MFFSSERRDPDPELKNEGVGTSFLKNMFYVYILENARDEHYIGNTGDLKTRLKRHNQNSVRSTKNKGPFAIVYQEEFDTRTGARIRENQLKQRKDKTFLRRLVDKSQTPSSSLV